MTDDPAQMITSMVSSIRKAVDRLAEQGRQAEKQLTPLMRAAQVGDEAAVLSLLEAGADVNAMTQTGCTALGEAVFGHHPAIVRLLMQNKANASASRKGYSALHSAAALDELSCAEALLDCGAEINARDTEGGQTPLMEALSEGDGDFMGPNVARLLIKRGANILAEDNKGKTVLHYVNNYEAAWSPYPNEPWLGDSQRALIKLVRAAVRDQEDEKEGIRRGLEASDAGRVRPFAEVAAEMRAKYNLPTHLSDEEIFSGEEGLPRT